MKNNPPKYLKELESHWKRNKATYYSPDEEDDDELSRPKGLRAHDLMHELWRLGVCWKNSRFEACFRALLEHGIVEDIGGLRGNLVNGATLKSWKLRFTDRKGPGLDEVKR